MEGGFIWFRGSFSSKLDRLFISMEWFDIFFLLRFFLLERFILDYCLFLVLSEYMNWDFKFFFFFDCWFFYKNCYKVIKEVWSKVDLCFMMDKFRMVKECLKVWNKEEFGEINERINKLIEEIDMLDKSVNLRIFFDEEI